MQTINRYAPEFCGCVQGGQLSPHSSTEECRRNQAATVAMLNAQTSAAIDSTIAAGELHAARHESHYRPQYGCPLCPLHGQLYRKNDGSYGLPVEAAIPA